MPNDKDPKDKMVYAKFIDFLEKNDPTGLSQAYYKTLIGKYEKTYANDGFVEADRKALDYIKRNDPTGFIKFYYEETKVGIYEKGIIKSIDEKLDVIDKAIDKGIKDLGKFIGEKLDTLDELIKPIKENTSHTNNGVDNNKNLPKNNSENILNR